MLPLVIETGELADYLAGDPEPRPLIVDICRDEIYQQQHLPGAVHISPGELVSGIQPAVGKLPSIDRLESLFSRIGYDKNRPVIVYDDEGGGWAGRFIWTLDVIGHQQASYLNGGLIAWASEGRAMSSEVPVIEPAEVSLTIDPAFIAEKQDVLDSLEDPGTCIWDARSAEEYAGTRVAAARGGHIPGAINLDWLMLMDRENQLRLRTDLADLVAEKGFSDGRRIITHCQTHHRSGLTYLAGKLLGLDIRAYHGSWSEWGNDPDTPIDNPAA